MSIQFRALNGYLTSSSGYYFVQLISIIRSTCTLGKQSSLPNVGRCSGGNIKQPESFRTPTCFHQPSEWALNSGLSSGTSKQARERQRGITLNALHLDLPSASYNVDVH
ncbi:hypothetical protein CSKR_202298 [Clonorchis sinensis]|uniref:Uncharacterized protein n=1 Tax=Clonorchis sinensis TaxID=79923 RepID=A0A8T1MV61_CLOSI|nr:hypothetical protein CSKR_202298 [Clonorchis sinensis]